MLAALLLALFPLQARSAAGAEEEVVSANGRFAALLAPTGARRRGMASIRERDPATGEVGERELWRAAYTVNERPNAYVLSEDGRALVVFEAAFGTGYTVARISRLGQDIAVLSGSRFGLELRDLPTRGRDAVWFQEGPDAPHSVWVETEDGPVQYAMLLTPPEVGGEPRYLDLETGAVFHEPPLPPSPLPRVEDERPLEELRPGALPFVERLSAPTHALLGQPVRAVVEGRYPTPGWALIGYGLEFPPDGALVLVPISLPPPPGFPQPQVLAPLHHLPVLLDLPLGEVPLRVRGRRGEVGEVLVRVLPHRFLADLLLVGGEDGLRRQLTLYRDAAATYVPEPEAEPSHHALPLDDFERILGALAAIDPAERERGGASSGPLTGTEPLRAELVWREGEELHRASLPRELAKGTLLRAILELEHGAEACHAERVGRH